MGIVYGVLLIMILLLIVEVLAIALKLTGLDMEKARFQVISIITNTGFTTRESELITQHPSRRRIAQALMLISYVGTATMIGLIINIITLITSGEKVLYITIGSLTLIFTILWLVKNKWLLLKIERFIEKRLEKQMQRNKKYKTVEEVLKLNDEYGVAEFIIGERNRLIGVSLEASGLKQTYIQVLNVDRGSHMVHFPSSKFVFQHGDKVIVYGKLYSIKELVMEKSNEEYAI